MIYAGTCEKNQNFWDIYFDSYGKYQAFNGQEQLEFTDVNALNFWLDGTEIIYWLAA